MPILLTLDIQMCLIFLKEHVEFFMIEKPSSKQMPLAEFPSCRCVRRCTKVMMQGTAVRRAVDLMRLTHMNFMHNWRRYLVCNTDISDKGTSLWEVFFTDNEDDIMEVGDDSWSEFQQLIEKIYIYTQDLARLMPKRSNIPSCPII